jgi:cytochrome c oxidase accessory protein FixG
MAGFAREQVCEFMCPYARFQSAMFDKDTLIISYDEQRGEPRGKHKQGDSWEGKGHCIDCMKCVNVCPMGIDIRNGLQMECIACGLCVDACNETMDMVGLARGLIRYDTERNKIRKKSGLEPIYRILRPRTIYYSLILGVVGCTILYLLLTRSLLDLNVLHDRSPLFVTMSDGTIRNGYNIKILNKTHEDRSYRLEVEGIENKNINIQSADNANANSLNVYANSVGHFRVFISADAQKESRKELSFKVIDNENENFSKHESLFISRN